MFGLVPADQVGGTSPYPELAKSQPSAKDHLAEVHRLEKQLQEELGWNDQRYSTALAQSMSPIELAANLRRLGHDATEYVEDNRVWTVVLAAGRAVAQIEAYRRDQRGKPGLKQALALSDLAFLLTPLIPNATEWLQAVDDAAAASDRDPGLAALAMKDAQRNFAKVFADGVISALTS